MVIESQLRSKLSRVEVATQKRPLKEATMADMLFFAAAVFTLAGCTATLLGY